jgi:hypothetical protein
MAIENEPNPLGQEKCAYHKRRIIMQKWEYCVITGVTFQNMGISGNHPILEYFSINGIEKSEDLGDKAASKRPNLKNISEGGYIASVIARLGNEGWEMVGTGYRAYTSIDGHHCIYFRRPIE